MRGPAVAFLLVAVALGGCSDEPGSPLDPGTAGEPTPKAPQDILIEDAGELAMGGGGSWSWNVTSPARRFNVDLDAYGLEDAPIAQVHAFEYSLTRDGAVVEEGFTGLLGGAAPLTIVRYRHPLEGSDDDPRDAQGHWTFTFSAAPSPARYEARILVAY